MFGNTLQPFAYIFLLVFLISLVVQRIKPQPSRPGAPQESNPARILFKYETAPVPAGAGEAKSTEIVITGGD